ncbi:MAG: 16S rRNA (uracil(1498)-N(3))-methyltransferase [Candidatus Omnitrophica bacterium]|nr:16S rRNA (uracil(1498)-N(3))-methyltransferase [Candidatus Omnitrophota bacterium]
MTPTVPRIRCYLPKGGWDRSPVRIAGREAHHLLHVLRVTPGFKVTCFDGEGNEAEGVVAEVTRRDLLLRLKGKGRASVSGWQITLGVAIPQGGKLDQIVNEATQLGVSRIIPLSTARGVVKVSAEALGRKLAHWTRIAVEAGKQSGVSRLPAIDPVTSWSGLIRSISGYDLALIAAIEGPHEEIRALLSRGSARTILLLIGPEGDFTPEEIRQAVQAGAHRVSLGETVLRCETAAVAAVSILSFLLRENPKG